MNMVLWEQRFIFQSTLSARRATSAAEWLNTHQIISIHALREESDVLHR